MKLQRALDSTTLSRKTLIKMIYYYLWLRDMMTTPVSWQLKRNFLLEDRHSILFIYPRMMLSLVLSIWIVNKSTGYDRFPVKLLKVGADALSMILSELINMSIDECTFPDLLKYAEIADLFKKLDRLWKENYRPVSILTALSKVCVMYCRQLTFYFDCIFSKYLQDSRSLYCNCRT